MSYKIDIINFATRGLIRTTDMEGGNNPIIGWAYQDFNAGDINTTSVNLSSQPYGTFDVSKIINNSAFITKSTGNDGFVYSIASKAFGSIVKSTGNTAQLVTLNAVPNNFWGNVRIWYRYIFSDGLPANYQEAPAFIRDTAIGTAVDLINKSEIGLGNVDNTSDINKPISNATQTALDLKINKTPSVKNINNTNSPYSIISLDEIIRVDTTNDAVTITLPSTGSVKTIKWVSGTNVLTVNVTSSGTIDNQASYVFRTVNDSIDLYNVSSGVWGIK